MTHQNDKILSPQVLLNDLELLLQLMTSLAANFGALETSMKNTIEKQKQSSLPKDIVSLSE
jgi:hypothetical protein